MRAGVRCTTLYGTDVPSRGRRREKGSGYNPVRGAKVIEYARHVLDRTVPLKKGSHIDSTAYRVVDNKLAVTLKNGSDRGPEEPGAVRRLPGRDGAPSSCCCRTTACTWTSHRQARTAIGATDPAGVADLVLEAALSTILDLEDSVAVVDAGTRCSPTATGWAS